MCKKILKAGEVKSLVKSGGIFNLINKYKNNSKILKEIERELNKVKEEEIDLYTDKMVFACIENVRHQKSNCEKKVRDRRLSGVKKRKQQTRLRTQFSH